MRSPFRRYDWERTDPFDPTKLGNVSSWTAAGFAALTGTLTFLSIQGGVLDRILGLNMTASLWIFVTIGAGLVLSLLAAAMKNVHQFPLGVTVLAAGVLGYVTTGMLPPIPDNPNPIPEMLVLGSGAAVILLALVSFLRGWTMALPASLLIIAVICTSIGLYGAVKLSVISKGPRNVVNIQAGLERTEGRDLVEVQATAKLYNKKPPTIKIEGIISGRTEEPVLFGLQTLGVDEVGSIDQTAIFPVDAARFDSIRVTSCGAEGSAQELCTTVAELDGARDYESAHVSGALQPSGKRTQLVIHAVRLRPDQRVSVELLRGKTVANAKSRFLVTLAPSDGGTLRWTSSVAEGRPNQWVVLRAGVCDQSCPTKKTAIISRYKLP